MFICVLLFIRYSLDLDPNKKAKQVQSWYLYEQYKSLESNQLYATKALRDRSCQKRILNEELRERRARRRFCNQFGTRSSDCQVPKLVSSDTRTLASASTDDFIDSLCDLQASDATIVNSDHTYNLTFEGHGKDELQGKIVNYGGDIDSDEREVECYSDVQDGSEPVGANVLQVDHLSVEPMQQIKPIVRDTSEGRSMELLKRSEALKMSKHNGFPAIWSTMVTFAYQVLRLNHGNCYFDYSSQLMAAVLVCDLLCKGFSRMCNILQPYVTPIKFETEEIDFSTDSYTKTDYKRLVDSKCICRKSNKIKSRPTKVRNCRRTNKKYSRSKQGFINNSLDRANDREPSSARSSTNTNSLSCETLIRELEDYTRCRQYCHHCYCHRVNYIGDPMTKLCQYIDKIINDLED